MQFFFALSLSLRLLNSICDAVDLLSSIFFRTCCRLFSVFIPQIHIGFIMCCFAVAVSNVIAIAIINTFTVRAHVILKLAIVAHSKCSGDHTDFYTSDSNSKFWRTNEYSQWSRNCVSAWCMSEISYVSLLSTEMQDFSTLFSPRAPSARFALPQKMDSSGHAIALFI